MTAFLILAGVWCLPCILVVAWVLADRWLDRRVPTEGADAEWLAILRASEHPIHDELMAQRLRAELEEWGKR